MSLQTTQAAHPHVARKPLSDRQYLRVLVRDAQLIEAWNPQLFRDHDATHDGVTLAVYSSTGFDRTQLHTLTSQGVPFDLYIDSYPERWENLQLFCRYNEFGQSLQSFLNPHANKCTFASLIQIVDQELVPDLVQHLRNYQEEITQLPWTNQAANSGVYRTFSLVRDQAENRVACRYDWSAEFQSGTDTFA